MGFELIIVHDMGRLEVSVTLAGEPSDASGHLIVVSPNTRRTGVNVADSGFEVPQKRREREAERGTGGGRAQI